MRPTEQWFQCGDVVVVGGGVCHGSAPITATFAMASSTANIFLLNTIAITNDVCDHFYWLLGPLVLPHVVVTACDG